VTVVLLCVAQAALSEFERVKADLRAESVQSQLKPHELLLLAMLDTGAQFIKYGRLGKPKAKFVNLSNGKLFWAPAEFGRTPPTSSVVTFLAALDIKGVLPGKITKVLVAATPSPPAVTRAR
jgi:hypothetical protein